MPAGCAKPGAGRGDAVGRPRWVADEMLLRFRQSRPAETSASRVAVERRPLPMAGALTKMPPTDFVRLVFLGDLSAPSGRDAPVLHPVITGILQSADLVIANCDSPVVRQPRLPMRSWLGQRRHMDAGALLGVIAAMGIEPERLVLSVANDSALDQEAVGFEETLETLASLQIRVAGVARRGLIQRFSAGPLSVGLVAFSEWRSGARRRFRKRVLMTEDLPETTWQGDDSGPDLLCAFPHWGRADTMHAGARTQGRAARLAAQGVQIVAGHHQGRLQPLEQVGGALVAYGLGIFHGPVHRRDVAQSIGAMLIVDVSTVSWERGKIAAYELFAFARLAERNRERIVPVDSLPESLQQKAEATFAHVRGRGS